jgi:hypothetical protein
MSRIPKRFIATDLDDGNIGAGANIATSKFADALNFLLKNAAVAWTVDQDAGNRKLTNLATGTNTNDAVNLGQLNSAISNLNSIFKPKPDARAATTANISLTAPGATHDGITMANGEVLFVRVQTAQAENGLYTFNGAAAALTRITQMDAWNEIPGATFSVEEGTVWADTMWLCTSNQNGTLGTTAITFQQIPTSTGLSAANFVDNETPAGTINGVNVTFTLANTPAVGSEKLYNGPARLISGSDYTITGASITMSVAPQPGELLRADYRK